MRVAVIELDGYVSPRLAWSPQIRLAVIEHGQVLSQAAHDVHDLEPAALTDFACTLAPDMLVCNRIPPECEQTLLARGIPVVWGVIGTVGQVIRAVANGRLHNDDVVGLGGDVRGQ